MASAGEALGDLHSPSQVKLTVWSRFLLEITLTAYRLNQPLLYVPLSSFRLRPSAPYASIPSLVLGCSPLNFLQFEHRFLLPTSPRGSVASRCLPILLFLSFRPLLTLRVTHLSLLPWTRCLVPSKAGGPIFSLIFLSAASFRFSPDQLTTIQVNVLSVVRLSVSRLVRFLSLAISLPSQIVSRLATTSSVLTDGFATRCAFCLSSLRPFKCAPDLSESQPLALGYLLLRNH